MTAAATREPFTWLPDPWTINGTSVERRATVNGRPSVVNVSTVVEHHEKPTLTVVVPGDPFIDDAELFPRGNFALYERIMLDAERFLEDNQRALLAAHREE